MLIPLLIAAVILGYLIGSIPVGYLFVRRQIGVNIFEVGSKSSGATNVKRVISEKRGEQHGRAAAFFVFSADALKGALATSVPLWFYLVWGIFFFRRDITGLTPEEIKVLNQTIEEVGRISQANGPIGITCLAFALVGHSYSVFTKFRGGKGVATAAGGLFVLMPLPLGIGAAVWAITFYASRYVSLASILAAVTLPVAAFFLGQPPLLIGLAAVIGAFVIFRHRANIVRLMNGTENRFVKKPEPPQPPPSA